MDWDINYLWRFEFVTLCVAIAIPAFLVMNKSIPAKIKNYLNLLTFLFFAEGVESYFDHVLSLVPDSRYELLRIIVSVVGYCLRPLMLYVVLLLMTRDSNKKHLSTWLFIPSFITIVISGLAFFTDLVFYYDANNQFRGGPLRYAFFVVLIIYFIMILSINIAKRNDDPKETVLLFGVIMLLIVDIVVSLASQDNLVHSYVMPLAVTFYMMHFLSALHEEEVSDINRIFTETEEQRTKQMLDQAIETLAYTIDAKDRYTKGHSFRVAKYSRQIAKLQGQNDEDCRKIYLAGLLHDIGKISIRDEIINKNGKLTNEEYEQIKKHPVNGGRILEKMMDFPFLQEGALYHHERYDGNGYPKGLKGNEIPEMARIIAVADAYDAMTSYRSYRKVMDQAIVKQEIWKGMGTQFDPFFAKLMISLIDSDLGYDMREKIDHLDEIIFEDQGEDVIWEYVPSEIADENQILMETSISTLGEFILCVNNWENPTESTIVGNEIHSVTFKSTTKPDGNYVWFAPTVLVFSSEDGKVAGNGYEELGVFVSAGYSWRVGPSLSESIRMIKTEKFRSFDQWIQRNKVGMEYKVSVIRYGALVSIKIENDLLAVEGELVLPKDYEKDVYFAITGEKCVIEMS